MWICWDQSLDTPDTDRKRVAFPNRLDEVAIIYQGIMETADNRLELNNLKRTPVSGSHRLHLASLRRINQLQKGSRRANLSAKMIRFCILSAEYSRASAETDALRGNV